VGDAVAGDVVEQRPLHVGVVVAVVERGAAGQEVDIVPPLLVGDQASARGVKNDTQPSAVTPDIGLATGENCVVFG